jgi:hypothetical protein
LLFLAPAWAQLPLQEILERLSKSQNAQSVALKNYTCNRIYRLHNARFHQNAEMTVRLNYEKPGRKDYEVLSESGSLALREKVLRTMIESEVEASSDELRRVNRLTPENYRFRLLRTDRDNGRMVYVLEASPKTKSKYLVVGEVWVDAQDFAVSRIIAKPAKSPSFWIRNPRFEYRYAKFGSFWLPVATDSEGDAVLFGHAEVQIRYNDYHINAERPESASSRSSPAVQFQPK